MSAFDGTFPPVGSRVRIRGGHPQAGREGRVTSHKVVARSIAARIEWGTSGGCWAFIPYELEVIPDEVTP